MLTLRNWRLLLQTCALTFALGCCILLIYAFIDSLFTMKLASNLVDRLGIVLASSVAAFWLLSDIIKVIESEALKREINTLRDRMMLLIQVIWVVIKRWYYFWISIVIIVSRRSHKLPPSQNESVNSFSMVSPISTFSWISLFTCASVIIILYLVKTIMDALHKTPSNIYQLLRIEQQMKSLKPYFKWFSTMRSWLRIAEELSPSSQSVQPSLFRDLTILLVCLGVFFFLLATFLGI